MRVVNILRNSAYSVLMYVLLAILGVLIRQAFTRYLPIELLGLEGLFTNVISFLSLAELGVSAVISYGLYREIANKNESEINMLMNIYRYVYFVIGITVAAISMVLFFALPYIVRDNSIEWQYVQFVYFIQVGVVLSTYFLAYRRTLFAADQRDYVCIRIDLICSLIANLAKLAAIVIWQSYILYASVGLLFNILANLAISYKLGKEYPFIRSIKVTMQDLRQRKFFVDMKNFLIHKISNIIYAGTDAIIISSVLGLRVAGFVANYILIRDGINSLLYKLLQGVIPTVGNLVYEDNREKSYRIYRTMDFMYFLLGSYVTCIYFTVLQPFMALFFGKEFVLDDFYVALLSINSFIAIQFESAYNFRSTYGGFENDRGYMFLSAVTNLLLSMLLVYPFGVTGVMVGTLFGLGFIVYGRVQFVFRVIFHQSMKNYWLRHAWWSGLVLLEILCIHCVLDMEVLTLTYSGLLLKCIIIAVFMVVVQFFLFRNLEEFQGFCIYAGAVKKILMSKLLERIK